MIYVVILLQIAILTGLAFIIDDTTRIRGALVFILENMKRRKK